jgi:hypothetical protein
MDTISNNGVLSYRDEIVAHYDLPFPFLNLENLDSCLPIIYSPRVPGKASIGTKFTVALSCFFYHYLAYNH